jgi:hypothetical protein
MPGALAQLEGMASRIMGTTGTKMALKEVLWHIRPFCQHGNATMQEAHSRKCAPGSTSIMPNDSLAGCTTSLGGGGGGGGTAGAERGRFASRTRTPAAGLAKA